MPFFIDATDDPLIMEVAQSFAQGQNSFTRASLLQEGQAALITNFVINVNGELRKRLGTRDIHSGYVGGQNIKIQGLLYFDSPTSSSLIAIVGGNAKYFDGLNWQTYFAAAIADPNENIDIVQLTDQIFWTDSNKPGIRLFDGATVSTVPTSPLATILCTITNRLVASGIDGVPDQISFSDILDGETWNINNSIRVGGGEGSPIVSIIPWQDTALVVLKRQGIYLVNCDPTQATAANFLVSKIHNTVGCVARRSAAQLGQDVWFLSRNGVMSVQKQLATSQNVVALPMSQTIQDVIETIRWPHAHKSCACVYNSMYLLSVPINSDEPDTVLAFNAVTGGWTIMTGWQAVVFIEQPFRGTTRLVMGCTTGEVREWLEYLAPNEVSTGDYRDGLQTITLPQTLPWHFPFGPDVLATVETRAFTFGDHFSNKSGFYGTIDILQADGSAQLQMIRDGHTAEDIDSYLVNKTGFTLPIQLSFQLPLAPFFETKRFPIFNHDDFLEVRFRIKSDLGSFSMRRLTCSGFMNTVELRANLNG